MWRSKKALFSVALLAILVALSGCERSGDIARRGYGVWKATIVDEESGLPVKGARVTIWGYGQEPWMDNSPDEVAKPREKGKWRDGFSFISDEQGIVCCHGVYTGGETVIERYVDSPPGRNPGPPHDHNHSHDHDDNRDRDHNRDHDTGKPRRHFLPAADAQIGGWAPIQDTHVSKGRWLAISVTAIGYQPHHFFFQPDVPEGNFGTIKLKNVLVNDGK